MSGRVTGAESMDMEQESGRDGGRVTGAESMDMEQESGRDGGRPSIHTSTTCFSMMNNEEVSSHHNHIAPPFMGNVKEEPSPKEVFPGATLSTAGCLRLYTPKEEPCSFQGDHMSTSSASTTTNHELTSFVIKEAPPSDEVHNVSDTNQPSLAGHSQILYEGEDHPHAQTSLCKVEPFSSDQAYCPPVTIKEEPKGEDPTNTEVSAPPDHTQCLPIQFKDEEDFPQNGVQANKGDIMDFECINIKLKTKPMQDKVASTSRPSEPSEPSKTTYACPVCKKSFSNHGNLIRHRETHKGKKMSCSKCGADFCNKTDLKQHARIHKANQVFYCSECNITFPSSCNLIIHEGIHTGEKPINHNEVKEPPKEESDSSLMYNFIKEEPIPQEDESCKGLPRFSFHIEETQSLDIRFQQTTSDIKAVPRLYEESPADIATLKQVKEKSDLAEKATPDLRAALYNGNEKLLSCIICSICDKLFPHESLLLLHQKEHFGLRPFSCRYCQKSFKRKDHCLVHQRIHTGEKPYSCTYCDKRFFQQSNLEVHERTHTIVKPFLCTFCSIRFSSKAQLQLHEKVHTANRRFCTICGKRYLRYEHREVHQRTHLGEKPYLCRYCHKGFDQSPHLVIHERIHTGEKPISCPDCGKSCSSPHPASSPT